MDIVIFKGITTEGVITSIEENSKKYNLGLVADMSNLPERTMVKKGAAEIGDIIKQLKTSRIKITKANTAAVNKEHDAIVKRLEVANEPYTDLLDAYNVVRKKELAAEDARKQAILDAEKKELDHEMALLIDKTYAYDQEQLRLLADKEEKRIEKEREEYAAEQVRIEIAKQEIRLATEKQDNINAENARLADKENVRRINNDALHAFMAECDFTYDQAKSAVIALSKGKILNVKINY